MQIQGYFCLGISIHWGVVLLPQLSLIVADGILTSLGIFAFGGNLLLMFSLHLFHPASACKEDLVQLLERVYTPPLLQPAAAAACFALVSYLCFLLAEVYRETPHAVTLLTGAFISTTI